MRPEPAALARVRRVIDGIDDALLSTGAVLMGRHDFVPDALRGCGAEIVFHKVAIRPGKPLLFASLPGGQLYFGLPGNPVSSAVGLPGTWVGLLPMAALAAWPHARAGDSAWRVAAAPARSGRARLRGAAALPGGACF